MELGGFFLFIFLLGLIILVVYGSLKTGISPTITRPSHAKILAKIIVKLPQNRVYDVGSGWGVLAFFIASKNPQKEVIGIEYSWVPYLFSKLLEKFNKHKNLSFIHGDFRDFSWKEDEIVLAYLYPKGMEDLANTLQFSKPAMIFSFGFVLPKFKPQASQILKSWWPMPLYMYKFGLHVKV